MAAFRRMTINDIRKQIIDESQSADIICEYFQRAKSDIDPITGEKWEGDDSKVSYIFNWLCREAAKAEDEYEFVHTSFDHFDDGDWEKYIETRMPIVEANLCAAFESYLKGEIPYSKAKEMMEVQKHMLHVKYQKVITDKLDELEDTETGERKITISIEHGGAK